MEGCKRRTGNENQDTTSRGKIGRRGMEKLEESSRANTERLKNYPFLGSNKELIRM